ncbi:MAG: glutathione ABC transporter substrate-binding protein [Deltaproteobacteria bacterium]|nr:glutathione ABC transporter substrate-binding protein [Deltaproteobacteria bacterium]
MNIKKCLYIGFSILLIPLVMAPLSTASEGGKTIVFAQGAEPISLDPPNQTDNPSEMVVRHIHDNLVNFTEKMDIVPMLATSWETTKDGLTWTFHLRKGVKFHDGTPFDADAVIFNLKRVTNPKKRLKRTALYNPFIKSFEAVDTYTVRIQLKAPFGALLAHFAHGAGGMVSPKNWEKYQDKISLHPVGTGPYIFEEWVPGDRIVLKRNDTYWKGKPKVEKIVFTPVPEAGSRVMMLETGQADVAFPIPLIEVNRLRKTKGVKVITGDTARVIYIGVNNLKKPYTDVRVRQALNYAVNKESIVKNILKGMAKPSKSMIGSLVWGYSPIKSYEYNPQKAKELLAEAGYPNGFEASLWTPEGRYPMDAQISEAVAGQLKKVGITVRLRKWEWAAFIKNTRKKPEEAKYEMFLLGWAPSTGDADWGMRPLFYSHLWAPKGSNRFYYKNPEVDKYIEEGMKTADREKRKEVYRKAQEALVNDPPWVMLHDMVQSVGVVENLENITVWPLEIVLVKDAYFK